MKAEIYLDGNATSAVLPAAVAAAAEAMSHGFGNPSSSHLSGLRARALLESVRARARRLIGSGDGELMFNSGATEGINTAVLSALVHLRERRADGQPIGRWLLCGATEHKAVPESLAHWNRLLGLGLQIRELPVDTEGQHDLAVLRALGPETALLCTMAANNETGVVSDLAGIEAVLAGTTSPALWLVDCVQALGKMPLNLATTRIDYAPFSGHKLNAPKGVGMLWVRRGAPFTPLMVGGGQEAGLRSGTENMAGIAALGAVLEALEDGSFHGPDVLVCLRDRIAGSLRHAFPDLQFNAPIARSLPTTLNFSVLGLSSEDLLNVFDATGMRVSAGSACSAARTLPSHVLRAMQRPDWCSNSAVRLSFGPSVDVETIEAACAAIARCGEVLKRGVCAANALQDGVLQWSDGVHCGWLVIDVASRSCVAIDPPARLVSGIAESVRAQGLTLLTTLGTDNDTEAARSRLALCDALSDVCITHLGADALGWPTSDETFGLTSSVNVSAVRLGCQLLVRLPASDGHVAYLLGSTGKGMTMPDECRFAFIGTVAPAAFPDGLFGPDTLLCPSRTKGAALPATTTHARYLLQTGQPGAAPQQLVAAALPAFLQSHPQALLIDVRDAREHSAGGGLHLHGWPALNVPMAALTAAAERWLHGERRPILLVCRSGQRAEQAAAWLGRIGYAPVWHLVGGLAQAEARQA
ncbi:MAG: aminotransferase class V-fold PLP-dependent enzyme [Burkholderiaceae bacterium]